MTGPGTTPAPSSIRQSGTRAKLYPTNRQAEDTPPHIPPPCGRRHGQASPHPRCNATVAGLHATCSTGMPAAEGHRDTQAGSVICWWPIRRERTKHSALVALSLLQLCTLGGRRWRSRAPVGEFLHGRTRRAQRDCKPACARSGARWVCSRGHAPPASWAASARMLSPSLLAVFWGVPATGPFIACPWAGTWLTTLALATTTAAAGPRHYRRDRFEPTTTLDYHS